MITATNPLAEHRSVMARHAENGAMLRKLLETKRAAGLPVGMVLLWIEQHTRFECPSEAYTLARQELAEIEAQEATA